MKPKTPIIHAGVNKWISSLAIPGHDAPFHVHAPAAQVEQREVFTKISESLLERPIEEYMRRDSAPIPSCEDREGYHGDRHLDWWHSGLDDYLKIRATARKHGFVRPDRDRVFEMGCASGRVLRHFAAQEPATETWGSDISLRHVEWVRQHLPASVKIFQNTVLPHLPIEDNFFSIVSAFSVFTHIDEFELSWLAEVRRILRPGGLAYLTIHSDHTWRIMKPEWPVYQALWRMRDELVSYKITQEMLAAPLPREKTVFRWLSAETYNTNVFHTADYIRDAWGRFLEVVEIIPQGHNYQDVVVLRKPTDA